MLMLPTAPWFISSRAYVDVVVFVIVVVLGGSRWFLLTGLGFRVKIPYLLFLLVLLLLLLFVAPDGSC